MVNQSQVHSVAAMNSLIPGTNFEGKLSCSVPVWFSNTRRPWAHATCGAALRTGQGSTSFRWTGVVKVKVDQESVKCRWLGCYPHTFSALGIRDGCLAAVGLNCFLTRECGLLDFWTATLVLIWLTVPRPTTTTDTTTTTTINQTYYHYYYVLLPVLPLPFTNSTSSSTMLPLPLLLLLLLLLLLFLLSLSCLVLFVASSSETWHVSKVYARRDVGTRGH